MSDKKRIFSGIQPSGTLTLGNYLGAIKNWVDLQNNQSHIYDSIYCVVDLHAITVRQNPADLRRRTYETFALMMAAGLDPSKVLMFVQSHVSAHAELSWLLSCYTQFGELSRMTQFKDKSQKYAENINAGLFTYPVLMAADILLYQTDCVPVGADQKQHLELARDVANRFNNAYSETFKIPDPYIAKIGAKVSSLADPTKKMSKSDDNLNACIGLLDKPEEIIRKFKRAVTDSDMSVRYDEANKPGISNLMGIYSAITQKSFEQIEEEFASSGYGDFKLAVGECVAEELRPIREKFEDLIKNKDYLEEQFAAGAQKASKIAYKTLDKVYRKVGFVKAVR
jgi:tryptophanyl-tRNA synthetase